MKNYNLDDIKELLVKKGADISLLEDNSNDDIMRDNNPQYSVEEFDKAKTRILKYVFYKKRTESEIRTKFAKTYDKQILDDAIEKLKELKYIDDNNYIERAVNEFVAIKKLSLKELKYKLMSKGLKSNIIDEYISNNYDDLMEYEKESAKKLVANKSRTMEKHNVKMYLMKKGYKQESIREAIDNAEFFDT